jgi:hypothetical protein
MGSPSQAQAQTLFYKTFDNEKDAAKAYNEKAVEFFGDYADYSTPFPEDD